MKRFFAMLLCMGMLFALVPWTAVMPVQAAKAGAAQPVETLSDMRELLEQTGREESSAQENVGGYGLFDLKVSGSVATVTYAAPEDATVMVAIYTEDGKQLKASGSGPVSAREKTVEVTLKGSIPRYFQAAAYLVRTSDLAPLCDAFRTSLYTQDMQTLLKSKVGDYPKDRVINLDDDDSTNFMVLQKGVVQAKSTETTNLFTTVDRANNRYVIENADKSVTGLQVGGHLVHLLADGSWIITKVATISVNGKTVTIQGEAPAMEDVFSHVKLENKGTVAQMEIDESTLGEGVTFKGITTPPPAARMMSLRSGGASDLFFETELGTQIPLAEFEIELKAEGEAGNVEGELTSTATVFVGFIVTNSFYEANGKSVAGKQIDCGIKFSAELEGKLTGKALELGDWTWKPIAGVSIGFEPFIGVEHSGSIKAEMKAVATTGLYHDPLAGSYCKTNTEPKVDANVEMDGELFLGLDLNPTFEVLEGALLDADVTAMVGLFFTGDMVGTAHGDLAQLPEDPNAEQPKQLHSCTECVDGEVFAGVKLGLEIEMLGMPVVQTAESELFWARKLSDFFVRLDSLAYPTYGLGTCPDRRFRVTVEALDDQGDPVSGGEVTATRRIDDLLQLPLAKEMGTTNANGIVSNYIPGGWYTFGVNGDADRDNYVKITGVGKVRIDGRNLLYAASEPGGSLEPLLEKIMDAGAVIASGKKGTIAWSMTQGGLLSITGTGELTEKLWSGTGVRPKVVSIGEGITAIQGALFAFEDIICVSLPGTLKTIGGGAFSYTDITSIQIPEGVTTIEQIAFQGCSNLTSVTLPDSLTTIGVGAFESCGSLNNVILPRSITRIESQTFYNCRSLSAISLGNRVTVIGASAFDGCTSLAKINLHNAVTEIGGTAFERCPLTEIELPESVQTLGGGVFWYCENLRSVRLPSGLRELPMNLFRGCKSLTEFNMPVDLQKIGNGSFRGCASLTSLYIPDTVTEIDESAFAECTGLWLVKLPSGLTTIGSLAFSDCNALQSISIPASVNKLGSYAFQNCVSLREITLPQTVTQIPMYLFDGCSGLASVRFLGQVTDIGGGAFRGCGFTEFTVPETVTQLGAAVFKDCEKLRSVRLPEAGLEQIPDDCFRNCASLISVNIPDGVTRLGTYAFSGCASLRQIVLPDGVKVLSQCLFEKCSSLEKVVMSQSVTTIGDGAFQYCTGMTSFDFPDAITDIARLAFRGSGLKTVNIPGSITVINDSVFEKCEDLKTVVLPLTLEQLEDNAFKWCASLESINIPAGIPEIPYGCFYGCTSLQSIYLPDGLTSIGSYAFVECKSLGSVRIPNTLLSFGSSAFTSCENLGSIYIPEGVTGIGSSAFEKCSSLTTVTIPRSVQSMGTFAFSSCKNLSTAYFEGDAPYAMVRGWFIGNEMTIYYPRNNATWTQEVRDSCEIEGIGHKLTWIPYDPPVAVAANAPVSRSVAPAEAEAVDNVAGGEYTQETISGKTVKTASYTDLIPGGNYLLLVVANAQATELLAPDNVLYFNQVTADKDGKLSHSYIQRTATEFSFVLLCGGPRQDLSGATVTFPAMRATSAEQAVNPVVELDGKQLIEGVDYCLEGDATYTKGGTYTCTIRGIYAYTGVLQCTYTVADYLLGDVDGNNVLNTDDAVYLLLHVMFGEKDYPVPSAMALNMDGKGGVTTDDAVYLLLHVMFGEKDYPLVG